MKILHVAHTLQGGIATYLSEMVPYQVEVLGSDSIKILAPAEQLHHISPLPGVLIEPFAGDKRQLRDLLGFAWSIVRAVRAFRPDIIHLHSSFAGAVTRLLRMIGMLRGAAVVYCPHGWAFTMEAPSCVRALYAAVERALLPFTDVVINISNSEHQAALSYGFDERKMTVILNGISAKPPGYSSPVTFDSSCLNMLFVGRLDYQKGLDVLTAAMGLLGDHRIRLHIVGEEVVSSSFEQRAALANATFYGWQPRDRVHDFIRASDAVIMPSRWEGFGLVAVEAMRCGRPVIASRIGALPELIEDGVSGLLFPPGDAGALASILEGLTRSRLRELGSGAYSSFIRSYTADQMNERVLSTYRDLCGATNGAANRRGSLAQEAFAAPDAAELAQGSGKV